MKSKMAMGLLGSLALVLAVAAPADAQAQATEKLGFLCELDLTQIKNKPNSVPNSVFTLDTRRHCPSAGKPNDVLTLECKAKIPGWPTGKASNNKGITCRINLDPCGVPPGGFINAKSKGTLNIDASGNARLFCKH